MNREKEAAPTVSYFVHEGEMARLERINKRITAIAALEAAALALIVFLLQMTR